MILGGGDPARLMHDLAGQCEHRVAVPFLLLGPAGTVERAPKL
jgi:hypothetical protein